MGAEGRSKGVVTGCVPVGLLGRAGSFGDITRRRWFVDETYVRVNGVWRYVYRAIDQDGQVIDVLVSARRDATNARRFFQRAYPIRAR